MTPTTGTRRHEVADWLISVLAGLFFVAWLFALIGYLTQSDQPPPKPQPPPPVRYIVVNRPAPARPANTTKSTPKPSAPAAAADPTTAEAKAALMTLGLPAKAAEAALVGTTGSVEERVKQALQRK